MARMEREERDGIGSAALSVRLALGTIYRFWRNREIHTKEQALMTIGEVKACLDRAAALAPNSIGNFLGGPADKPTSTTNN